MTGGSIRLYEQSLRMVLAVVVYTTVSTVSVNL